MKFLAILLVLLASQAQAIEFIKGIDGSYTLPDGVKLEAGDSTSGGEIQCSYIDPTSAGALSQLSSLYSPIGWHTVFASASVSGASNYYMGPRAMKSDGSTHGTSSTNYEDGLGAVGGATIKRVQCYVPNGFGITTGNGRQVCPRLNGTDYCASDCALTFDGIDHFEDSGECTFTISTGDTYQWSMPETGTAQSRDINCIVFITVR